jgi:hypothetical protein
MGQMLGQHAGVMGRQRTRQRLLQVCTSNPAQRACTTCSTLLHARTSLSRRLTRCWLVQKLTYVRCARIAWTAEVKTHHEGAEHDREGRREGLSSLNHFCSTLCKTVGGA